MIDCTDHVPGETHRLAQSEEQGTYFNRLVWNDHVPKQIYLPCVRIVMEAKSNGETRRPVFGGVCA